MNMGPTVRHSRPHMCSNILFFFTFSLHHTDISSLPLLFCLFFLSFLLQAGFFQLLLFFLSLFFFFGSSSWLGSFIFFSFFLFLFSFFSSSLWFLFSTTYYSSSFFLFLHAMMEKGFNFSGLRCAFWAWSCGFCGVIFLVFLFVFIFIIYMQKNLL